MPISVHIPAQLLHQAESRAKALGISRNRLIVRALENELQSKKNWSPEFFERLSKVTPEMAAAVDDLLKEVKARRRSKPPLQF